MAFGADFKKRVVLLALPSTVSEMCVQTVTEISDIFTQTARQVRFGPTDFIKALTSSGSESDTTNSSDEESSPSSKFGPQGDTKPEVRECPSQTPLLDVNSFGVQVTPAPLSTLEQSIQTVEVAVDSCGIQCEPEVVEIEVQTTPESAATGVQTERVRKTWRRRISRFFRRLFPRRRA